jgi:hypothetical protein
MTALSPLSDAALDFGLSLGRAKENRQRSSELFGRFLGHVMPAIDAVTAEVRCPRPPHSQDIAIKQLEIVPERPENKRGAGPAFGR